MIDIQRPQDCCGCTACASICAHNAITMLPDSLGFLYPHVDKEKCVECGLCEKVCAFNDNYDKSKNLPHPDAYAARHKDIKHLESSRSGAAFIAISDRILEGNGVIYGVGYEEHFRVVHKRATTKEERNEFKGSKYVQSDLTGIFRQIKNDLKNGLTVLFSGTPCQTSGLASYIGKSLHENLFLVDIICHGVPGPYLWRDYLEYLEKKQGSKICWVNFRDKQLFGWKAHKETFKFVKEEKKISFKYLFYQQIMFRYSCGQCHFANTQRPSDITIGDFWGWEKTCPDFNKDDKGISLVLINTEKGRQLFKEAAKDLTIIPAKLQDCLQPNLIRTSPIHKHRSKFENDYKKHGFKFVYYKYGNVGFIYKLRSLKNYIKKILTK